MLRILLALFALMPGAAVAAEAGMDLTMHPVGFFAIAVFVVAYALVMGEEVLHLRKSNPC